MLWSGQDPIDPFFDPIPRRSKQPLVAPTALGPSKQPMSVWVDPFFDPFLLHAVRKEDPRQVGESWGNHGEVLSEKTWRLRGPVH